MAKADLAASEAVRQAAEELRQELEERPLRSDVSVSVRVVGAEEYILYGGRLQLAPFKMPKPPCDVDIVIRDEITAADLVARVREAVRQNDLARVLLALLYEMALPWASRTMDVTGVSSLAQLLWSAWIACDGTSDVQRDREQAKRAWADEDLSQGWVVVPTVSPGIKDRVEMFQRELDRIQKAVPDAVPQDGAADGSQHAAQEDLQEASRPAWLDELFEDLAQKAVQFQASLPTGLVDTSCTKAIAASSSTGLVDASGAEATTTSSPTRLSETSGIKAPPASAQEFL